MKDFINFYIEHIWKWVGSNVVVFLILLMSGCASYGGSPQAVQILECTERMTDRTGAHVIDTSDVCLKAYRYADTPRSRR